MNTYLKIKKATRAVETEIKQHIRKHGPVQYFTCGLRWMKAIDRLAAKRQVKYSRKHSGYVLS